jgi:hypothetical protein
VRHNDAAYRRCDNRTDLLMWKRLGNLFAYPLGVLRVLQHQSTLQITRAMQTGSQYEMAFEQGSRLLEYGK